MEIIAADGRFLKAQVLFQLLIFLSNSAISLKACQQIKVLHAQERVKVFIFVKVDPERRFI